MNRRVAVVTGSAGGIGREIVARFEAAGWIVVGLDREQGDLADAEVSRRLFEEIGARHGRIDVLINNAAVQLVKPLLETSPLEWDEVMAVNLRAPYLAIRHSHPWLCAAGNAAIVNVASVHALATSTGMAAYAASKGGLLALTRSLALELAPDRIRVNAVLPGAVDTPLLRAALSRWGGGVEAKLAGLAGRTPLGRIGAPSEIAAAVHFLSDGEFSSFATGATLVVDGGATARLATE